MTKQERDAFFQAAMSASQQGDAGAYRELLGAIRPLLLGYVRRILGRMGRANEATTEDLVQDIMLAVHNKRHTYDPTQPFLPWLFAIARYKVIDFGRSERRRPLGVTLDDVEHALATPVFTVGAAQDLEDILSALPEKTRQLVTLLKVDELSVAEAAAMTGMSESAVKVTVHRALKSLRARFAKEGAS